MPLIRKVYDGLLELERELAGLKRLVLQEREDMVSLDLNGMGIRRVTLDEAFARLGLLNARIAAEIEDACRTSGVTGTSTLTALLAVIPKPDREQFVRIQAELQRLGASVENELAVNRALLKDSLNFTDQSLSMFTAALKTTGTSTYGSQGRFVDSVEQPRIICKEI